MPQTNQTHSIGATSNNISPPIIGHLDTWGIWERMVPEAVGTDRATQSALDIHLRRYETVGKLVQNKKVLDIASGTGFGSKMLKDAGAEQVVGVDIAPESVAYAREHYATAGVEFLQGDAEVFDWHEPFDVIITYETVEHVPHPDMFLQRLRQLIRPDGHLFLSVPLGETRHIDPYHLHAFDREDIFTLIEASGFNLEGYRIEPWKTTWKDIAQLQKTNPEASPPVGELLFTKRGRSVLWDYLTKGGIGWDWLLVSARPRPEGAPRSRPSVLQTLV
jgi:2-polyprenyl-3-methyl-5-hydroxy-6-metoxy-1,4-benzoquinol methylase